MTGQFRIEMQQADALVDELQDALDADAIEEGRLEVLKQQLLEAQEEVKTHEGSYGESIITKDKNNESLKATRNQMARIDKGIEEAELKVRKAESRATETANDRLAALRDKNAAIEAAEKEKNDKKVYEEEREAQAKLVDNFFVQAADHCERVPIDEGENVESLEKKYYKLEKDLGAAEKRFVTYLPLPYR